MQKTSVIIQFSKKYDKRGNMTGEKVLNSIGQNNICRSKTFLHVTVSSGDCTVLVNENCSTVNRVLWIQRVYSMLLRRKIMHALLPPANECLGQGNVFTLVYHSVQGGGEGVYFGTEPISPS